MLQAASQFEPVDAGYVQIRYDDVGDAFESAFERLQPVMGLFDAETRLGQPFGIQLTTGAVVFDEQDAWSEPQR